MLANGYLRNHVERHECFRWDLSLLITVDISLGLLMKYDCKVSCHVEPSQYEILDLLVIQYISGSRNIKIDLYKGDKIYALWSIYIRVQRSNCTHEYYHKNVLSNHLTFLSLG